MYRHAFGQFCGGVSAKDDDDDGQRLRGEGTDARLAWPFQPLLVLVLLGASS